MSPQLDRNMRDFARAKDVQDLVVRVLGVAVLVGLVVWALTGGLS
jgi:hypothetical protein